MSGSTILLSNLALKLPLVAGLFRKFNPLSCKSDQHELSPYDINALENIVVMEIEYMFSEDESN